MDLGIRPVRNRTIGILKARGIEFEKAHHEVTPSQHEINLKPIDPLNGAHGTLLFSFTTKKVANEFGYHATFMPKPFDGFNRSAFHIQLSIQDFDGKNLFYDEDANNNFSDLARQFVGRIPKYTWETSIIMASTFNSYKAYILERDDPKIRS